MKSYIKLMIVCSLLIGAGILGTAMAYYDPWEPITAVDINSHDSNDIVFAGGEYTVTCTTSSDKDCNEYEGKEFSDPVTHTWSGAGTFNPTTGTSVTWTAPSTTGNATITVTADDDSAPAYGDDPNVTDSVTLIVQNIIYVDQDADGSDNGTSWANAFTDLQDALAIANYGNEIWVANGDYAPCYWPERSQLISFELVNGVAMYGGFAGTETARSQRDWTTNQTVLTGDIGESDVNYPGSFSDNSDNVVKSENCDSNTVLDGFIVKRGYANQGHSGQGGGMKNRYSSPTITNCVFRGNVAQGWTYAIGGGMWNFSSSPTITNCVFADNLVSSGSISRNSDGGGMYNDYNSSPTIINCVFSKNTIDGYWGEVHGGGISNDDGSSPTIINCIFNQNVADGNDPYGGGICNYDYSSPTVINCIFWDNGPNEIHNHDDNSDPNFSYCDIEGGINGSKCGGYDSINGGGNIDADPNFVDANDPDGNDNKLMTSDDGLRLDASANSPCIDAADGNVDPTKDILDNSRYDDPNTSNTGIGDPNYVDMGAYEYQG